MLEMQVKMVIVVKLPFFQEEMMVK